jgi:hypothetical protein
MAQVLNGTTVDLGSFSDSLNLAAGNNVVTTFNVETVNASGTGDDTVTLNADFTMVHTINLGGGTNILNLATAGSYSMSLSGNLTVNGTTGDEAVTLSNVQLGTTFDLGAGNDTLTLFSNDPMGVNVVTVANIENVNAIGSQGDQIHIAGNSGGITTVTAGGGADQIWASADEDHFRFVVSGDSPYDLLGNPAGGLRDAIFGFNADDDVLVFDGAQFTAAVANNAFTWELTTFGGADIVRVDLDGNFNGDDGWEMAIEITDYTGTFTNSNILIVGEPVLI